MTAQNQTVANSFLSPVAKYIEQKRFHDAAVSLLLLIRAFDFEKQIFQFVESHMDELSFEDQKAFIEEITKQVRWSKTIVDAFARDKGRPKLENFVNFLFKFLSKQSDFCKGDNETDKATYFADSVLKLSNDKEIRKAENEPFLLPIKLLKEGRVVREIIAAKEFAFRQKKITRFKISRSNALVDSEGRIVLPQAFFTPKRKTLFREAFFAPAPQKSKTIRFVRKKGGKIGELIIFLEFEEEQIVLSFARKPDK